MNDTPASGRDDVSGAEARPEATGRVPRTVPQRAASSMSRAQWENATASMRAIAVGGEDLAASDEADVQAALASLDLPPADSPSMPLPPAPDSLSGYLDQGQRLVIAENRTTMLDRTGAPQVGAESKTSYLQPGQRVPAAGATTFPAQAQPFQGPGTAAGSTMVAPPTMRREPPVVRPAQASRPYDEGAYVSQPRDSYHEGRSGSPGAAASIGSGLLKLVAVVFRIAAIALIVLIALTAIPVGLGQYRIHIVNFLAMFDKFIPQAVAGRLCIETVFGGIFRGDLAVMALVMFVIDWLLMKAARAVRGGA